MIIINDTHLGVQRTGGTTPQSACALREYGLNAVSDILNARVNEHFVVNGDLFDKFEIDTLSVITAYEMFADWLNAGTGTLTLCVGNHDWAPRGNKLSSFHLLCRFLKLHFGVRVLVVDKGFSLVDKRVWAIPHMPNQDLFALEVEKACETKHDGDYLLLHCNVKNTFAEHSDHSLNLTDDLLAKLMVAGWTLIVGHEHQGYTLRGGRVVVVGNQFPTSVADCIGETSKHALRIMDSGIEYIETWSAADSYAEVHWRDLAEYAGEEEFIRVVGDATAAESADVISNISKFRQRSNAYVITNAVKVEGVAALDEMSDDAVENIKAFDVLGTIFEHLDGREVETVKELLA